MKARAATDPGLDALVDHLAIVEDDRQFGEVRRE